MKSLLYSVVLLLLLLPFVNYAQPDVGKFKIIGELSGIQNKKVYLRAAMEGKRFDSADVDEKGRFEFAGILKIRERATIYTKDGSGKALYFYFYPAPGIIHMTGDMAEPADIVVSGSETQDLFGGFNRQTKDIRKKYESKLAEFRASYNGPVELSKRLADEYRDAYHELLNHIEKFIEQHPSSLVSLDMMPSFIDSRMPYTRLKKLFDRLSPALKSSETGKNLAQHLQLLEQTNVGKTVPDFTFKTLQDSVLNIADLRGKYVHIDFWASWCGPCRMENPFVKEAWQKYKDKGFTVLMISLDDSRDAWIKAINKDGLQEVINVLDLKGWNSELLKQFGVKGIPENYLIDTSGKIIARELRGGELERKLMSLFQ